MGIQLEGPGGYVWREGINDADVSIDTLLLQIPQRFHTIAQIVARCRELQESFQRPGGPRKFSLGVATLTVAEVWRAMRNVGGDVSPPPRFHPREIFDLHDALDKLDEAIEWCENNAKAPAATSPGKTPDVPLFNADKGILILQGRPLSLGSNESDLLGELIKRKAATLQELRGTCDSPNKVLSRLCNKYPALKKHITLPGKKGRGGYSTTIRLAETI